MVGAIEVLHFRTGSMATVEERLAALEERTAPRPKSVLDVIKEWGGVATAVIALLYTFPLGVWDRFVLTERARVEKLRELAVALAEEDANYATRIGSIEDQQAATFYTRAVSSKKFITISKNMGDIVRYADKMGPPELLFFAYSFGQAGNVQLADRFLDLALGKLDPRTDSVFASDIYRIKATQALNAIEGVDMARVRANFGEAVSLLDGHRNDNVRLQLSNSLFEWASIEMGYGDWACGERLGQAALAIVTSLPPTNPIVRTYLGQFDAVLRSYSRRPGQEANGCPEEIAALLEDEGMPAVR
jgi:hypothetical protein